MTLGSIEYLVTGTDYARFYSGITKDKLVFRDMHEEHESISVTVPVGYCKRFETHCKDSCCAFQKSGSNGIPKICRDIIKRPGLLAGALLTVMLMAYYSNVILRIDIDTDDPAVRDKISDVLAEDGVKAGAYLPDIDLVLEERSLKQKIDDAAWIGITRTGSGIAVDIIKTEEADKGITIGMPCHLVACEDGVIEEVELLDGQLLKCIGSGVTKGDIVVSGKMISESSEWTDKGETVTSKTRYVRSLGKVKGTFTRTEEFRQLYDTEIITLTGNHSTLRYLNIFSAEIPLFLKIPDGNFSTAHEEKHYPEINGYMLPFGMTEIELDETDTRSQLLTEDEAFSEAEKLAYNYENNFLKNYEILDRECIKSSDADGVTLTVTYTLYGDLCRESDFFIPRYILPDEENPQEKNVQDSENN